MDPVTIGWTIFSGLLSAALKTSDKDRTPEEREAITAARKLSTERGVAAADKSLDGK